MRSVPLPGQRQSTRDALSSPRLPLSASSSCSLAPSKRTIPSTTAACRITCSSILSRCCFSFVWQCFFFERMSPPFALKQNQGLHFKEQGSRAETAGDLADRIEDLLDEMRRLLLRPGKAADVLPVGLMESPSPLSVSSPNCRW
jgi:hypothetical protein